MALIEQHLPRQRNSFVHPFLAQRPHLTPSVPALLPALAVPPDSGPIPPAGNLLHQESLRDTNDPTHFGGFLNIIPLTSSTPLCVPGSTGLHLCPPMRHFPQKRGAVAASHMERLELGAPSLWTHTQDSAPQTLFASHHKKMQSQKLLQMLFPY